MNDIQILPFHRASIEELFARRLEEISNLHSRLSDMEEKDLEFATSLILQFSSTASLSPRQWEWVDRLNCRYASSEPLYGSFAPILVMFRIAGAHGLKAPKIRLMSAENRFVQLNFRPAERDERTIKVFVDGWQGHGHRKFAGWVKDDRLIPYATDRMTTDVKNVIQDLALDPIGTAKAMALKLSACLYCGQRLSDQESKDRGYGPVCAEHYEQPWGKTSNQPVNLEELFA